MAIIQWDSGHFIRATFEQDLTGATVTAKVFDGVRTFDKACEITDAENGKCRFELLKSDLSRSGYYNYQFTAKFADGDEFSTVMKSFRVEESIKNISGEPAEEPTNGSGILVFDTVADLEAAYPNGTDQPVWITSENSWYYWDGAVEEPSDTTAPIVTPSVLGGTYSSAQTVTLSVNETATIYYTLDGSTPTESSPVYSTPLSIPNTTTLKYFAKDSAGNSSAVQTQTYTITVADTTPPTLTITPGGTFTDTQQVTMSTNETATIWYTLDDSDPKTSGTKIQYTAPLTLTETDTIKAYAVDGSNNESVVQTVTYTKETATGPQTIAFIPSGKVVTTSGTSGIKGTSITMKQAASITEIYISDVGGAIPYEIWEYNKSTNTFVTKVGNGTTEVSDGDVDGFVKGIIPTPISLVGGKTYLVLANYPNVGAKLYGKSAEEELGNPNDYWTYDGNIFGMTPSVGLVKALNSVTTVYDVKLTVEL